jgi:hypothetical protein
VNYKSSVFELFKQIPEILAWEPTIREDEDSPYIIFGALARYIQTKIIEDAYDTTLKKSIDFLNEMANTENSEIESLLTVGVLEILTDDEKVFDYVLERLNDKGRRFLVNAKKFWQGSSGS